MAFLASLIQTLVKMAIIVIVALGGVKLGKKLRDNSDAKKAAEAADAAADKE